MIVGYVTCVKTPKPDVRQHTLFVDELWVAEKFRRRCAARALVLRVKVLAEEIEAWKVRLVVDVENHGARKLYQFMGFSETSKSMFCEYRVN